MFTGIVQAVGQVRSVETRGGDCRLHVYVDGLPTARLGDGASLAVNGVCLTVAGWTAGNVLLDMSRETLLVTTLGNVQPGQPVNLEPALILSEPLGGHLVSGHVDGIGEITDLQPDARSTRLWVRVPASLAHFIARKGSLCLDGVSLTVNEVSGEQAGINIVPHTIERTIMRGYTVGTTVNVEVDLIARYLERLLQGGE